MAGIEGDVWRQEYDRSNDPKREPGPIELNRYITNSGAYSGIPTFMNWPVCITPKDLKAGNIDVAVIGAPIDMSLGRRGGRGHYARPNDTWPVARLPKVC